MQAYHTPHELRVLYSDSDPNRRQRDPLLDQPTEPHPLIDKVMEHTLNQLALTANGATGAWGPDSAMRKGSKSEASAPTASDVWTVEQLAWDYWYGATTHRGRFRVILEAQQMVRRMRKADPSLIKGTEAWKARILEDPRSNRACADDYGVSFETIRRIRKAASA